MKRLPLASISLLALGALAIAQTISVPQRTVLTQTDLIQVIPGGIPSAQSVYSTPEQITNVAGYYKAATTTGFTYTFTNAVTYAALRPAGTLAAGYVILAPTPSDGSRNCVFTTQTITAFYVAANTGQSINNAFAGTALSANTGACYLYGASNATWDRS